LIICIASWLGNISKTNSRTQRALCYEIGGGGAHGIASDPMQHRHIKIWKDHIQKGSKTRDEVKDHYCHKMSLNPGPLAYFSSHWTLFVALSHYVL